MNSFWNGLGRGARTGLAAGVLLIVVATAAAFYWTFRLEYQVLFSGMSMQDASAMSGALERLKIPYKLADNGASILVDKDAVLSTRMKLMGQDLPLHGAVGFELFNNTDFGMTEFAQKVNFQRALQGELTRTIQAMSEIREVRVHLAIPEQSLFRQSGNRTKAAINISLKPGAVLRKDQVAGIQRLVAAAVPGMALQDVTIVDEHGVALTRPAQADGASDGGLAALDMKRETEAYLVQKVGQVLESAFGPGQAIASVDVSLNLDQVRLTQESVLAPTAEAGLAQTGVVVRERESTRGSDNRLADNDGNGNGRAGTAQRETEYQVGKRVEQIVSQPGAIQHVQVLAAVRKDLDAAQLAQLRKLIATAAGASEQRGDVIEVQTLGAMGASAPMAVTEPAAVLPAPVAASVPAVSSVTAAPMQAAWQAAGVLVILLLAALVWLVALSARRGKRRALSENERRLALARVQQWMQQGPVREETF